MALLVFMGHAVLGQKDSTKTGKNNGTYYSHQKDTTTKKKPTYASLNLANRPNDHFIMEFSYDNWVGKTDSMRTTGFCRGFGAFFMFDFPFKTDPHWSVGAGIGIYVNNIFFDKTLVLVAQPTQTLAFRDVSQTFHFKKYKLVTTDLDIPLELRYAFNPENTNKSWKIALGIRVGVLLSAYTKAKNLLDVNGNEVQNYIEKTSSKQFFNSGHAIATMRVNYGWIGVFGTYQLTPLIANNAGPAVYPYSIGLVLSGL